MAEQEHQQWTARRDDSGGEPGLWSVADASGAVVFFGMHEDRARLFAAAPDMLAVLNACRIMLKNRDQRPEEMKLLDAIKAVVAKAEGREHQHGGGG